MPSLLQLLSPIKLKQFCFVLQLMLAIKHIVLLPPLTTPILLPVSEPLLALPISSDVPLLGPRDQILLQFLFYVSRSLNALTL